MLESSVNATTWSSLLWKDIDVEIIACGTEQSQFKKVFDFLTKIRCGRFASENLLGDLLRFADSAH